jgi:hypothetical protein
MGSASQRLSQFADGGLLSPCMAYLLLCDAMFWGIGYPVMYLHLFKAPLLFSPADFRLAF